MGCCRRGSRTCAFVRLGQAGECGFASRTCGMSDSRVEVCGEPSDRRLIALSRIHGMFVAASTSTPVSSCPTPFICTRNSVLIRRLPSLSPSPREPASESSSSMKMIDGFCSRAIWNSCLTSLSGASGHRARGVHGKRTVPSRPATCSRGPSSRWRRTCCSPPSRPPSRGRTCPCPAGRRAGCRATACACP
jgi:hypothetical protein